MKVSFKLTNDFKKIVTRQNTINIIYTILGCFITSIGINMFLVNAHLLSGGVSGIALILQYTLKFPAGISFLVINIPLLLLSYKLMGKRFTAMTMIGTIAFSIAIDVTAPFQNVLKLKDNILLCVYGGVLNGLGMGLVLSNYGSTGGLDIVSAIIKKKYENFEFGTTSFIINMIIVSIGAVFFGIYSALYTLFSIYISSFVIDRVLKGFSRQKLVMIITNEEKKISDNIMYNLKRGVTFLYGEGAYTGKKRMVIYCIVGLNQLPLLKNVVTQTDKNSFISVIDISEVQGEGFKGRLF